MSDDPLAQPFQVFSSDGYANRRKLARQKLRCKKPQCIPLKSRVLGYAILYRHPSQYSSILGAKSRGAVDDDTQLRRDSI
jgi:hypothetical protein